MRCDLTRYWYQPLLHPVTIALLPCSWLFRLLSSIRRGLYRTGVMRTQPFSVPVIVVGNITVGGTGKTPLVIWLAQWLQQQGYHPGIVSRGMGGRYHRQPYSVSLNDAAAVVGDEALLLKQQTGCPLVLCADRAAAVRLLEQQGQCDMVISDDGLQHYRMSRDIEIAVVDGTRHFGNQQLLPAGPLREPISRLNSVDVVVVNQTESPSDIAMSLEPRALVSLTDPQHQLSLADFSQQTVHAVAGIGNPQRFFQTLKKAGLHVIEHVFPDHHLFTPQDLDFKDAFSIVMTEKDAVKCKTFAIARCWYLQITVNIDNRLPELLRQKLLLKHATPLQGVSA